LLMEKMYIDHAAVWIAAAVNVMIGCVWYSRHLFGAESETTPKSFAMLWTAILSLVTAYVLGLFELYLGVTTVTDGLFVGFLAWAGFVATTHLSAVIWCSTSWRSFLIHNGCRLLGFLAMGGILGA